MQTLTIELLNDDAINLLQDLELLKLIRISNHKSEIPDWHKSILEERITDYEKHPDGVKDFNSLLDELYKSL